MAIDTTIPRSRRALLGATLGAVAATAAATLGRPVPARAGNGDAIVIGAGNTGSAETALSVSGFGLRSFRVFRSDATSVGVAFLGQAASSGDGSTGVGGYASAASGRTYGVSGQSDSTSGRGVWGQGWGATGQTYGVYGNVRSSAGTGVYGEASTSGTGVRGVSSSGIGVGGTTATGTAVTADATSSSGPTRGVSALSGSPDGIGVEGENYASTGNAIGVEGRTYSPTGAGVRGITRGPSSGTGVLGFSGSGSVPIAPAGTGVYGFSASGTGVHARSSNGSALRVSGKATFSRSGKLTIAAGATQATKSAVALASTSLVLATIQGAGESGLYVRNVSLNVAGSSFTVRLSKAPAASTTVAWFIVN